MTVNESVVQDDAITPDTEAIRRRYAADGVARLPKLIEDARIPEIVEHLDRVVAGVYETEQAPFNRRPPLGDPVTSGLVKVDQPHRCDDTIHATVTSPSIGRMAAAVTGASFVQVFAVQLLHKDPIDDVSGSIGWHQDEHYWRGWYEGEAFTIWLALSDVTLESGPVCFVRGSHQWGYVEGGDLYNKDLAGIQAGLALPEDATWDELVFPLAPGEATIHNRMTFHGSRPNHSAGPRRGLAIHLRTERSTRVGEHPVYTNEADLHESPIIWDNGPVR